MPNIVIALDFSEKKTAIDLAKKLQGQGLWVKVGMELFTREGPEIIHILKDMGYHVFLDLKFHDIPNTVQGAMYSAASLGVDMANVHISGGEKMVKAALQGAEAGQLKSCPKLIVLGVTVLTSLGPHELKEELDNFGFAGSPDPEEVVLQKALKGKLWGLPGIVCSAHEVKKIKEICGKDFICLTPGIRLKGDNIQDQKRVTTPAQAAAMGSDFLVIGRSVTQARDPIAVINSILKDLEQ